MAEGAAAERAAEEGLRAAAATTEMVAAVTAAIVRVTEAVASRLDLLCSVAESG